MPTPTQPGDDLRRPRSARTCTRSATARPSRRRLPGRCGTATDTSWRSCSERRWSTAPTRSSRAIRAATNSCRSSCCGCGSTSSRPGEDRRCTNEQYFTFKYKKYREIVQDPVLKYFMIFFKSSLKLLKT